MYFCKNVPLHFENDSWNLCFNKEILNNTTILSLTDTAQKFLRMLNCPTFCNYMVTYLNIPSKDNIVVATLAGSYGNEHSGSVNEENLG